MRSIFLALASLSLAASPAAAQGLFNGGAGGPGNGPSSVGTAFEFEALDAGLGYAFSLSSEGVARLCIDISSSSIGVHVPQFGGGELVASHAGGNVELSGIHESGGCTVAGTQQGTGNAVAALTLDGGAGADLVFDIGPQGTDEDLLAVDLASPSWMASAVLGGPGGGVSTGGWGSAEVVFDGATGSSQVALPSLGVTVTVSPVLLVVTGPGGEEVFSASPSTSAFYAPGTTLGYSSDKDILEVALSDSTVSSFTLDGQSCGLQFSGTTAALLSLSGAHHNVALVDSVVDELAAAGTITGYSAQRSSVGPFTGSGSISGQGWNHGGNGGNGGPPPSCPLDLDGYGCSLSAQPLFLQLGSFGTPPDDNADGIVCLENGTTTDNCVE